MWHKGSVFFESAPPYLILFECVNYLFKNSLRVHLANDAWGSNLLL